MCSLGACSSNMWHVKVRKCHSQLKGNGLFGCDKKNIVTVRQSAQKGMWTRGLYMQGSSYTTIQILLSVLGKVCVWYKCDKKSVKTVASVKYEKQATLWYLFTL